MIKPEQIPWQVKEQLGRWLYSGASHEECIAAALNAWPRMEVDKRFHGNPDGTSTMQPRIILPLTENGNE